MRKHILTRLRSLLGAACAAFATGKVQSTPSKHDYEPDIQPTDAGSDAWMFDTGSALETTRDRLSEDMTSIATSLSELRETLALINGDTPFPVEATTQRPCAIVHHDEVLFDGEVEAPYIPAQEEVSGGEGMFLFDDVPSFQDSVQEHQQQAA